MLEVATFAGGCFWCTEAIFQRLKGVFKVTSGYTGGQIRNPSYERVSMGTTGHAEAIQIEFDPQHISYKTLLEIFWQTHDPTTLNQQGNDIGTQYRSAVFYHSREQQRIAETIKAKLEQENIFDAPIVTTIEPFTEFFPADASHQNYYNANPEAVYCNLVISPKINKRLKGNWSEIKEEYLKQG